MSYSSIVYTSPRLGRLSRQAHSYHAHGSRSFAQSPYKKVLQQDSKYMAASLGRSNRISRCLFPLISKFEALNALSHGMKEPSLRSAPLQISRSSSPRRGGFDGPASMKLEAIFSPSRSQSRHEPLLLENLVVSPAEDMFTSGTIKWSGSGKLKLAQSPQRVNSIRFREGTQQSNLVTKKERSFGMRLRCQNTDSNQVMKGTKENSIVRDRIRFFDGCIEHTPPSSSCTNLYDSNPGHSSPLFTANTNTRSSLRYGVAPTTPTYHLPACTNHTITKLLSGCSTTGGSVRKTISTKSGTPHTPTKSGPRYVIRTHRPFEQHEPSPFLQTLHTNPHIREVFPKTPLTGWKPDNRGHIRCPLYGFSKVPHPIEKGASPEEKRGRTREQQAPEKRISPTSLDRRRTSRQLQASHRDDTPMAKIGPKDKDMKMLQERGVVAKTFQSGPWSLSQATGTKIPRPKWRNFSNVAPSASSPYVLQSSTTKSGEFPPKPASNSGQIDGTRIPSLIRQNYAGSLTPAKATCRGIHDKIKQWESKVDIGENSVDDQNNFCSSKNVNKSMAFRRSILENPWNNEIGKELEKRGLDGQEIQAVVDEVQNIGEEIGDADKGKWEMVVAPKFGRAGPVAQNDGETDEGAGDMDMRIIVKEAQCALEEPKPLRMLEMKRMILLCRERVSVGGLTYRGRGAGYPVKA